MLHLIFKCKVNNSYMIELWKKKKQEVEKHIMNLIGFMHRATEMQEG